MNTLSASRLHKVIDFRNFSRTRVLPRPTSARGPLASLDSGLRGSTGTLRGLEFALLVTDDNVKVIRRNCSHVIENPLIENSSIPLSEHIMAPFAAPTSTVGVSPSSLQPEAYGRIYFKILLCNIGSEQDPMNRW